MPRRLVWRSPCRTSPGAVRHGCHRHQGYGIGDLVATDIRDGITYTDKVTAVQLTADANLTPYVETVIPTVGDNDARRRHDPGRRVRDRAAVRAGPAARTAAPLPRLTSTDPPPGAMPADLLGGRVAIDDAYPTSASTLSTMAQWEGFFTGFSADGVIPGVLNEMVPSLNAGARTAVLGTGAAQIRGFHVDNPSSTATSIPTADAQNRIDRLVLRLDRTAAAAADWITPVVIEGTPSATPQIPALAQTSDGDFDVPIARWTSASNGSLSGLVDERVFAAASPVEFRSDARPSATLRRIGIERDTNKVLFADGTMADRVGRHRLGRPDPERAQRQRLTNNIVSRVRRRNGHVHLRISIRRWSTNGLGTADEDGSVPFVLSSGFRPSVQEVGFGFHSRSPIALRVESDGSVRIFALTADVPVNRTVLAAPTTSSRRTYGAAHLRPVADRLDHGHRRHDHRRGRRHRTGHRHGPGDDHVLVGEVRRGPVHRPARPVRDGSDHDQLFRRVRWAAGGDDSGVLRARRGVRDVGRCGWRRPLQDGLQRRRQRRQRPAGHGARPAGDDRHPVQLSWLRGLQLRHQFVAGPAGRLAPLLLDWTVGARTDP